MAINLIPTLVVIPEELYHKLQEREKSLNKSIAAQIEEALSMYLAEDYPEEKSHPEDPIWDLPEIGDKFGSSNLSDLSVNRQLPPARSGGSKE